MPRAFSTQKGLDLRREVLLRRDARCAFRPPGSRCAYGRMEPEATTARRSLGDLDLGGA